MNIHLARPTELGLAAVAVAAVIAAVAAVQTWVEPRLLFMDMIAASEAAGYCCKPYWAFLSNVGVIVWSTAAAVSAFAALLLLGRDRRSSAGRALAVAGALGFLIALDDLLMLHESVLPGFGVPQNALLLGYGLLGGAYAALQWRELLSRDGVLLWIALLLFAGSVGLDVGLHSISSAAIVAEDGFKLVGVVSWAAFHVAFAFTALETSARRLRVRA